MNNDYDGFNICRELRCPFNGDSGCRRFSGASLCPVGRSNPDIRASEYWLFASARADIDINVLRDEMSAVVNTEQSQRQLRMENKVKEAFNS